VSAAMQSSMLPHLSISANASAGLDESITAVSSQPLQQQQTLRCELCGFRYAERHVAAAVGATDASVNESVSSSSYSSASAIPMSPSSFRCTRCGLESTYTRCLTWPYACGENGTCDAPHDASTASSSSPSSSSSSSSSSASATASSSLLPVGGNEQLVEAARAYRFILLSKMSPLLSDLARIVVDYLIWYRGPDDFRVGDLVDARDFRGKWYLARVRDVRKCPRGGGKVLVHFLGFNEKWDCWISALSDSLAPCHTKTREQQQLQQLQQQQQQEQQQQQSQYGTTNTGDAAT